MYWIWRQKIHAVISLPKDYQLHSYVKINYPARKNLADSNPGIILYKVLNRLFTTVYHMVLSHSHSPPNFRERGIYTHANNLIVKCLTQHILFRNSWNHSTLSLGCAIQCFDKSVDIVKEVNLTPALHTDESI